MVDLHQLGDSSVFDTEGQPYTLGQAWAHQTAVLVFLRHFG